MNSRIYPNADQTAYYTRKLAKAGLRGGPEATLVTAASMMSAVSEMLVNVLGVEEAKVALHKAADALHVEHDFDTVGSA